MAKRMETALLYDFYGDVLTDKQRDMFEQYYHQDLSLSEIAENAGVSRQAVRDAVKRAELQLTEMEDRLGAVARLNQLHAAIDDIVEAAQAIRLENEQVGASKLIEDNALRIAALANALRR